VVHKDIIQGSKTFPLIGPEVEKSRCQKAAGFGLTVKKRQRIRNRVYGSERILASVKIIARGANTGFRGEYTSFMT
jgi:hypothetical protein